MKNIWGIEKPKGIDYAQFDILEFVIKKLRQNEKEGFDEDAKRWAQYREAWNRGHELLLKTFKKYGNIV